MCIRDRIDSVPPCSDSCAMCLCFVWFDVAAKTRICHIFQSVFGDEVSVDEEYGVGSGDSAIRDPCASLPNSLATDLFQTALCFGLHVSCL